MPSRLKRRQQTGSHHFITFSCHDRRPYVASTEAKSLFERTLEATQLYYGFHVVAYVVMPEHVHLVVSEPPETVLGTALGVLKRNVSAKRPEKPFWLPRYYDFNISENDKLFEKLRYIHRNPVRRGLVETPEQYAWSSFRNYALREQGTVTIARAV
jgi:putative transposase